MNVVPSEPDDSAVQPLRIAVCGPVGLRFASGLLDGDGPVGPGRGAPIVDRLVGALHARGHHVSVVTLSPSPADCGSWRGNRFELEVGTFRPRLRWVDAFRHERQVLATMLARTSAEVVHAQWTYEYALAAIADGRPSVVTVRDWSPAVLRAHRDHYRLVRLGMQLRVLRTATTLTANSPYVADQAAQWAMAPVAVVPNFIDFPAEVPVPPTPDRPTIGSLCNGFDRLKNTGRLLEAYSRVRARFPDAVLRLAGAGHEPSGAAAAWAAERGIDRGVEFLGHIPSDNVPEFLDGLSVLAHPSIEESFSMAVLEAVRAGVPVVAGQDAGGVPWVLGNGADGRLVDVGSATAIADGIMGLLEDPVGSRQLAQRAFTDLSARFGVDRVVQMYDDTYRAALSTASRRSVRTARAPQGERARAPGPGSWRRS